MNNLGFVREDSTVDVYFTTNDSSGGAIAPSTAFEAADVAIYRDGIATQKTTTNGLTMTSPFDSITGLHHLAIDTSNDTGDTNFWRAGSSYTVVLNPSDETVDSQTVVAVIATFTLDPDAFDEATGGSSVRPHVDYGWHDDNATVIIPFVTRNSSGLATPDSVAVTIYKGSSTTQKATANGLTTTLDFDSVTGKHLLVIDTSNDTGDAGFWTAGSTYHVDIQSTTPSAQYGAADIVAICGATFRLGTAKTNHVETLGTPLTESTSGNLASNQSTFWDNADNGASTTILDDIGDTEDPLLLVSTTIATLASQTSFTLTAGSADDDAYNGAMLVAIDQSTNTQRAVAQISDYVGSTRTVTLETAPAFTVATGDTVKVIASPQQLDTIVAADPAVVIIPRITVSVTSSAGSTADLRVWAEDGNGQDIDLSAYTTKTASVTFTEVSGGVDLFTQAFVAGDISHNAFVQQKASPGFTSDRQYVARLTITLDGTAYTKNDVTVVFG